MEFTISELEQAGWNPTCSYKPIKEKFSKTTTKEEDFDTSNIPEKIIPLLEKIGFCVTKDEKCSPEAFKIHFVRPELVFDTYGCLAEYHAADKTPLRGIIVPEKYINYFLPKNEKYKQMKNHFLVFNNEKPLKIILKENDLNICFTYKEGNAHPYTGRIYKNITYTKNYD